MKRNFENMKLFASLELYPDTVQKFEKAGFTVNFHKDPKTRPKGTEMKKRLKDNDVLMVGIQQYVTADMLDVVKTPKIIATQSMGLDHLAKECFTHPLIKVLRVTSANGNAVSVAEHIMMMLLALNKKVNESNFLLWDGQAHRFNMGSRPFEIKGKILGLIGSGTITKELIKFALAFDLKLICHTQITPEDLELEKLGVKFVELDDLLKNSDFINILVPLNDGTRNLISREKIQLMKPTACFINCARTAVVDTHALVEYADTHPTFTVGLDIDIEGDLIPLFKKQRHNVIVTPHTAGLTHEAVQKLQNEITNNILDNLDFLKTK